MKKYLYPAVFTTEENGAISVEFPDIKGCFTSGDNIEEAYDMAQDALCLMLYDMENSNQAVPTATTVSAIKVSDNQFVSLISCDTVEYRKFFDNKAVKKTLTIPAWLNTAAEKQGINFSSTLQEALKNRLQINN